MIRCSLRLLERRFSEMKASSIAYLVSLSMSFSAGMVPIAGAASGDDAAQTSPPQPIDRELAQPAIRMTVEPARVAIRFDREEYVLAQGDEIPVRVMMDPVPEEGLFSYGIKVGWSSTLGAAVVASALQPVVWLDFDGVLGPGAAQTVEAGFVTVRGTVDFDQQPMQAYRGAHLVTVTLRGASEAVPGSYELVLGSHQTLGPTEALFVTGAGSVLDQRLDFGRARLVWIPEPSVALLGFFGGLILVSRHLAVARRRTHRSASEQPDGAGLACGIGRGTEDAAIVAKVRSS